MLFTYLFFTINFFWIASEIYLSVVRRSGSDNTGPDHDKNTVGIIRTTIIISITTGVFISMFHFGKITAIPYLSMIGLALIVAGLAIRWTAILTLKNYFTVDVNVSKDQKVITSGIYKLVKHPSYSGSLISIFGLSLVFSNIIGVIIINIPIIIVFIYRMKIEEEALIKIIGDEYIEYSKRTKRLLPKIY